MTQLLHRSASYTGFAGSFIPEFKNMGFSSILYKNKIRPDNQQFIDAKRTIVDTVINTNTNLNYNYPFKSKSYNISSGIEFALNY